MRSDAAAQKIAAGGLIAAIYILLTMLSTSVGLSSGFIQLRLSEALYALACFTPAAIPGLTAGCLISNILSGCALWDVVFGTIATFIGALGMYKFKENFFAASLVPVASNTIIVSLVLAFVYSIQAALPVIFLSIGISELIACTLLGRLVFNAASKIYPLIKKNH